MDIADALAPASDQLDAIELVRPRTFTIDSGSRLGAREGKTVAEIRLVDFDRVWRPSKGMLDALVACWGTTDATQWVGRRVTLYNDPDVMFGKDRVGGVRISHVSHIDKARDVTIRGAGRTHVRKWHVEPLADDAPKAKPARKAAEPTPAPIDEPFASADRIADMLFALEAANIPKPDRMTFVAQEAGRAVEHPHDLTAPEVDRVITAAKALLTGGQSE